MSIYKGNLTLFGSNSHCLSRHALQEKPHNCPGMSSRKARQVIGQIRRSSGSSSERAISPNFWCSTLATVNVSRHGIVTLLKVARMKT